MHHRNSGSGFSSSADTHLQQHSLLSHNDNSSSATTVMKKHQYTYNKKKSCTFYFILFFVFLVIALLVVSAVIIVIPIVNKVRRNSNHSGANISPSDSSDFVDVKQLALTDGMLMEIRYSGYHNFVGRPVAGYLEPKCLLTKKAATQLVKVQAYVEQEYKMTLKIYDCYRPQQSVSDFVQWSISPESAKKDYRNMRREFYPTFDNPQELFDKGYIAYRSGHTRGSTIDLTLVPLPVPQQPEYDNVTTPLVPCYEPYAARFKDNGIDMGTGFDCFHAMSHTDPTSDGYILTAQQKENRRKLVSAMERFGFANYDKEWWHYTLKHEPYPDTYFTFPVQ